MTQDTKPRGMSIVEAARYVGVSERTMRRAIDAGQVATRYIGRKVVVDVASLDAWFDQLPTERST